MDFLNWFDWAIFNNQNIVEVVSQWFASIFPDNIP